MTKLQEEQQQQHGSGGQRRHRGHPQHNPRRGSNLAMEEFIPPYLRRFINPYRGDFCFTRIYHHRLIAQLMSEGFLPIATETCLLPKLHESRCVISLPSDLHISKSVRKKSKRFRLSVNQAFDRIVQGCQEQHGERCWLYPPLVEAFKTIHEEGLQGVPATLFDKDGCHSTGREYPVRLYSIEVWNETTGELAGGELGYTVGSIYTSLTGFSSEDSAGSVQLAGLGRMLCSLGFTLWDLGMEMEYKNGLGCHLMPRKRFVEHVKDVREAKSHLLLPADRNGFNAKDLVDQTVTLAPSPQGDPSVTGHHHTTQQQHLPPHDPESEPPDKKKQRATK